MMPQPPILKINEIFASVQGEGLRQGEPTLFIRLAGCNLRCSFCDTTYAWENGEEQTLSQILAEVNQAGTEFPSEWVCLTGGEPLLQDLGELVEGLKAGGFKVQIETNGTLFQKLPIDWYTVSPKPDRFFFCPEYKKLAKEVKLIVTQELEFDTVDKIRREFPEHIPILLQPESNLGWAAEKSLEFLKTARRKKQYNLRLSFQMHKLFEIR